MTDTATDSTGRKPAGALFVVATPIGNLQDLSPRAAACLRDADLLLAEDTRHTRTLLEGLRHRASRQFDRVTARAQRTRARRRRWWRACRRVHALRWSPTPARPCMSDPGSLLVAAAARAGVEVVALPGPCAAIAALSIAGLATDRFVFEGFLPAKADGAARRRSRRWRTKRARSCSTRRRIGSRLRLQDLATVFGAEREAAVAREITKRFEHVYRGTLAALAQSVRDRSPT